MATRRSVLAAALVLALLARPHATPPPPLPSQAAVQASDRAVRIGTPRPGGGYTVSAIPLEAYVARVLAGEAVRDSPPASLEALAIAVRTYTLANLGRHRADGFDLCDDTHCQVMRAASPATERAASVTAGLALLQNGVPASIYYSASCGGHTEIPSAVWPGADDPSYLPAQPDDACGGAPMWSAELSAADLLRALRAGGFRGDRLRDVRIASRTVSGRVGRLRLDGLTPDVISGQDLRVVVGRSLGWQFIRSTAFELKRDGDAYRFSGHGSGHGVGMCVIGSMRLAAAGSTRDAILHRYFPGLTMAAAVPLSVRAPTPVTAPSRSPVAASASEPASRPVNPPMAAATRSPEAASASEPTPRLANSPVVPASRSPAAASASEPALRPANPSLAPAPAPAAIVPEILVSLPDGDEGERSVITEVAAKARTDLARLLGVAPPRLTLRFHPSADSYERATHEPWFTSGTVVNGEIHLLPPAVLRERGVLDRSVRHELVHVMTNTALAGRPLWVREGAAIYFAGEPVPSGDKRPSSISPRPSCPTDTELDRPVSIGALSNAYARARACFAWQLAQRRSWREVR